MNPCYLLYLLYLNVIYCILIVKFLFFCVIVYLLQMSTAALLQAATSKIRNFFCWIKKYNLIIWNITDFCSSLLQKNLYFYQVYTLKVSKIHFKDIVVNINVNYYIFYLSHILLYIFSVSITCTYVCSESYMQFRYIIVKLCTTISSVTFIIFLF